MPTGIVGFSGRIRQFAFDGGVVLFMEGARQLWALNPVAAYIFDELFSGADRQDVATQFASDFGTETSRALETVDEVLLEFGRMGILADDPLPSDPEIVPVKWFDEAAPEMENPQSWAIEGAICQAGIRLEFSSQDLGMGEAFLGLYSGAAFLTVGERRSLWLLGPQSSTGHWEVYLDGRLIAAGIAEDEVLPWLVGVATEVFAKSHDEHFILHAAAISRGGAAALFPAMSGSGKTTLAAGLARQGFWCLSDDLSVIAKEKTTVLPFPHPPSIKEGAVNALRSFYPGICEMPSWMRGDGKRVRYLPVQSIPEELRCNGARVHFLVFPAFSKNVPCRLIPVGKVDALRRVVSASVSGRKLTGADVEALIALVEGAQCYHLEFGHLDQALELVKGLFEGIQAPLGLG